ncbi:MAG: hypothetical protein WBD55_06590 [Dehalococcoidia bacterium]
MPTTKVDGIQDPSRRGVAALVATDGRVRFAVLLLLVALPVLASCGDDGDTSGPSPTLQVSPSPAGTTAETTSSVCAAVPEVLGTVASPDLIEISGLAASRDKDGVLWAHNDSGDTARVFAIGPSGEHLAAYTLVGAQAIDWEDMAIGPGPATSADYLYLADIGDNNAERPEVHVYRVPEPTVPSGGTPEAADLDAVDKLTLRYPDHAHDAETLLVDPRSGDLLIVTKELQAPTSLVFRAPDSVTPEAPYTLEQVAEIDFKALQSGVQPPPDAPPLVAGVPHLPTGGDVSPTGNLVAVRTYGSVWVWDRPDDAPLWEAFASAPCEAPSSIEPQGEAIAFDADGSGYTTVSEGANVPIHHFRAQ